MRALRSERGVAVTTVMLLGATLTVLTSAAVFVTVQDFRAGTDDRKAAEALAYAEAGVDRMVQYLRSASNLTYATLIRKGCADPALTLPQGIIGNGTFSVSLQVFNPNASSFAARYPQPPSGGACALVQPSPRRGQHFLITSTGEHPASKRVVQQVIKMAAAGAPVGLIADSLNVNGTPDLTGISILSEGPVTGRNQLDITGVDPYYTVGDFWPDKTWGGGLTAETQAPAAAHAVGGLFLGNNPEFPAGTTVNCTANKSNSNRQSLWDSDGSAGSGPLPSTLPASCTGQISPYGVDKPSTSKFTQTDFERLVPDDELSPQQDAALKRAAQDYGIYCRNSAGTWFCTKAGAPVSGSPYTDYAAMVAAGSYNYTAYYEFVDGDATSNWLNFPNSNQTMWSGPICTDPTTYRYITVRVKNGGFNLSGNTKINGAIIADGNFDYTGTPTINGTVMASNFRLRGTANFSLDACWVQNMPLGFLSVTPTQWSEADR